jgi:hypothetical protein
VRALECPRKESTMERLKNWRAKRAGGRITIYAKTEGGVDRRVPSVDVIEATSEGIIATDKDGTKYALGNPA